MDMNVLLAHLFVIAAQGYHGYEGMVSGGSKGGSMEPMKPPFLIDYTTANAIHAAVFAGAEKTAW